MEFDGRRCHTHALRRLAVGISQADQCRDFTLTGNKCFPPFPQFVLCVVFSEAGLVISNHQNVTGWVSNKIAAFR